MSAASEFRIDVVYPRVGKRLGDGVRDHGEQLVRALNAAGYAANHSAWARAEVELVIVQYTPFTWGHRGLAPSLVTRVVALRRRRPPPHVALMVHEPYLTGDRARDMALGLAQREQLRLMCSLADTVLVSIEPWQRLLDRWRGARPVSHLPVGSNLPDAREAREAMRGKLGLRDSEVVVAAFDSPHPGRSRVLAEIAARAAAGAGATRLLLLGAQATAYDGLPLRTTMPGALSAPCLAAHLAAADIFLAPFVDGVSTRRTTLIAALQHGLPIVGTEGDLTDPELRSGRSCMVLVSPDEPQAFGAATASLVQDTHGRLVAGRGSRELFDRRFAWAALVESMRQSIPTMDLQPSTFAVPGE